MQEESTLPLPHLRVSLFGDCNFRCVYCPPWGENSYQVSDRASTPALLDSLQLLAELGFRVVKLTGGEPTLRRDIAPIVHRACELFPEVVLITNGWNLSRILPDLFQAGLRSVEISLDTADPSSFDAITKTTGHFPKVLAGIRQCRDLEMAVQVNMVVMQHNREHLPAMLDLIQSEKGAALKLLELVYYEYPGLTFWRENFVDMDSVLSEVAARAVASQIIANPGEYGTPMRAFTLPGGSTVIVKDGRRGSVYADVCKGCAMFPCQDGLYGLTLTVDGMLKMCKHRPDLAVSLFPSDGPEPCADRASAQTVVDRYRSSYFQRTGWTPSDLRDDSPKDLVPPTRGVIKWYRQKEYGSEVRPALVHKDSIVFLGLPKSPGRPRS